VAAAGSSRHPMSAGVHLDRNAAGRTIYFLDPASAAGFVARWCTAKKTAAGSG
jgi:hypothetical protein